MPIPLPEDPLTAALHSWGPAVTAAGIGSCSNLTPSPPGSPTAMLPIERYRLGREAGES